MTEMKPKPPASALWGLVAMLVISGIAFIAMAAVFVIR